MEVNTNNGNGDYESNQTEHVLVPAPVPLWLKSFEKDEANYAKEHKKGLEEERDKPNLCI